MEKNLAISRLKKFAPRSSIFCRWCSVEFTPLYPKRKFCGAKCLKACDDAKYYAKNTDRLRAKTKKWIQEHKEHAQAYQKEYRTTKICKASLRASRQKWSKNNRAYCNSNLALYRAAKLHQTPPWLSPDQKSQIRAIYQQAYELSRETGVLHSVDHIIPLRGRMVRGLHVPWNLQILTLAENSRKGNRID